jgi:hypothetical protein
MNTLPNELIEIISRYFSLEKFVWILLNKTDTRFAKLMRNFREVKNGIIDYDFCREIPSNIFWQENYHCRLSSYITIERAQLHYNNDWKNLSMRKREFYIEKAKKINTERETIFYKQLSTVEFLSYKTPTEPVKQKTFRNKPKSAYQIFCQENRERIKTENEGIDSIGILKKLGTEWRKNKKR